MAVYLRWKKLADGRKSAYLDVYHNEKRSYEFLKIYILQAPRTPIERAVNSDLLEAAKRIRANRELEILGNENHFIPKFKKDVDFLEYFKRFYLNYTNKDIRLVKAAYTHFSAFIVSKNIKVLPIKQLSEQHCDDFKKYLQSNLHGETISNYWKKFKAVIQQALKDKLLTEDFTAGIRVVRTNELKKEILSFDEIKKLAAARSGNDQVKKAFLFCLNTGLRWVDVKALRWKNIDGSKLRFIQSKTKDTSSAANLTLDLNKTAMALIGPQGEPSAHVFKLPSHTACNDVLKAWVKRAEIPKHITWHCARHSLAVNLLDKEGGNADVKTVASILGHSGLNQIDKYLRIIDERKKQALNNLPEIAI